MLSTKWLVPSALLITLLVPTSTADAFCLLPWDWTGHGTINVLLDPDLIGDLETDSGHVWTQAEIEDEIRWVLKAAQDHTDADLPRLVYAGLSGGCSDTNVNACAIPNTIHIVRNPSCRDETTGANSNPYASDPSSGIVIAVAPNSCGARKNHFQPVSFAGMLLHELGHALGLEHPNEGSCNFTCDSGTWVCAVMDGATSGTTWMHHWYEDDDRGLVDIYGTRTSASDKLLFEGCGGSWSLLSNNPSDAPDYRPLFTLSSTTHGEMFIAGRREFNGYARAGRWDWGLIEWTDWGTPFPLATQGQSGAGYDGSNGFSAFQGLESPTNGMKERWFNAHSSPSSFNTGADSSNKVRFRGVSATHDPDSGQRIIAWRTSGRIRLQVVDGTGTISFGVFLDPTDSSGQFLRSFSTPNVACGDPAGGTRNCVLVWTNGEEQEHWIKWMHFDLVSLFGSWLMDGGPIKSQLFIPDSAPQVAYTGPAGASDAWHLLWYRDNAHHVATKSENENASWTSDFSRAANYSHAALGASNNCAEMMLYEW